MNRSSNRSVAALRLRRATLLLLAACVFRVWLVVEYNPMAHIWSDPGRHWHNGGFPLDMSPMAAIDPVGYQLYVGMLAEVTLEKLQLKGDERPRR